MVNKERVASKTYIILFLLLFFLIIINNSPFAFGAPPEFPPDPIELQMDSYLNYMEAKEGYLYWVKTIASDPEGDGFLFSLEEAPEGMEINTISGEIRWTPTNAQAMAIDHDVLVRVTDEHDEINEYPYTITVYRTYSSDHFIVRWVHDAVDFGYAERASNYLEYSGDMYTWGEINYGYDPPPNMTDVDVTIDVFIYDIPSVYYYGGVAHRPRGSLPPRIELDTGLDHPDDKWLKVACAHELFHCVQYAYGPCASWWLEATAVWMEDKIFNDADVYLSRFHHSNSVFNNPDITLPDTFEYGGCIFPIAITEILRNNDVIRWIWEKIDDSSMTWIDATELTLNNSSSMWNFRSIFAEFAIRNYIISGLSGHDYDEGLLMKNTHLELSVQNITFSNTHQWHYLCSNPASNYPPINTKGTWIYNMDFDFVEGTLPGLASYYIDFKSPDQFNHDTPTYIWLYFKGDEAIEDWAVNVIKKNLAGAFIGVEQMIAPNNNNPSRSGKIRIPFGGIDPDDTTRIITVITNTDKFNILRPFEISGVITPTFNSSYTDLVSSFPGHGHTSTVKNLQSSLDGNDLGPDEDVIYKNGDTIKIEVDVSDQVHLGSADPIPLGSRTITVDFSNIDSSYSEGSEVVRETDSTAHKYEINYTISDENSNYFNERSNVPIPLGIKIQSLCQQDANYDVMRDETFEIILDNEDPTIVSVHITQGFNQIYYSHGGTSIPANTGEITIRVQFSESMLTHEADGTEVDPQIIFGLNDPYDTHQFQRAGGWTTTNPDHENDTWIGTFTIPEDEKSAYDGKNTLSIKARDQAGNWLDSDPDRDGDQPDTSHYFYIRPFSVEVTPQSSFIPRGGSRDHSIIINNRHDEAETFFFTIEGSCPGWDVSIGRRDPLSLTVEGNQSGLVIFTVTNNNAQSDCTFQVNALATNWQINKQAEVESLVGADFNFAMIAIPPVAGVPTGERRRHNLQIHNLSDADITLSVTTDFPSVPGWQITTPGDEFPVEVLGNSTHSIEITAFNSGALSPITTTITAQSLNTGIIRMALIIDIPVGGGTGSGGGYDGPGHDHPDDNYSISSSLYPTDWSYDSESTIGVLLNGYSEGLFYLLGRYGISTNIVLQDLTIFNNPGKDLNDLSVLLIGSAGLSGLDSLPSFREGLASFVEHGGVLINFTSQRKYEWDALPGGEVAGYGWNEDNSCQRASVAIDTYHQIVSGQDSLICDIQVDGYFTQWPGEATIVLRRIKNDMPALITYPYGEGRVIAGCMFTDWLYGRGTPSRDEFRLIRDILAWTKEQKELPEYAPDTPFTLMDTLNNESDTEASKVLFTIIDPDQQIHSPLSQSITLGPGHMIEHGFNSTGYSSLGFWTILYRLVDAEDNVIQADREWASFVVSNHYESIITREISFAVNTESMFYTPGSEGVFTVSIWNHGDTDKSITLGYVFINASGYSGSLPIYGERTNTYHSHSPGCDNNVSQTIEVPAGGSNYYIIKVPINRGDFLWVDFCTEGEYLGTAAVTYYAYYPRTNVQITVDKDMYFNTNSNEIVFTCTLRNESGFPDHTMLMNLKVGIFDPSGTKIYQEEREVPMITGGTAIEDFTFILPSDAELGAYRIQAEVNEALQDQIIRYDFKGAYFTLSPPFIEITPQLPAIAHQGSNPLSFDFGIHGDFIQESVTLEAELEDPRGEVVWTQIQDLIVTAREHTSVSYDFFIDELIFGTYTLNYQIIWGELIQSSSEEIDCSALVGIFFDDTIENIREPLDLEVKIENDGSFQLQNLPLEIEIYDAEYSYSDIITLSPGQSTRLFLSVNLPETISVGKHTGNITLVQGDSVIERGFGFTVLPSGLVCTLCCGEFSAGDDISVQAVNKADTTIEADLEVTLVDSHGKVFHDMSKVIEVPAESTLVPCILHIPIEAAYGRYVCTIQTKNLLTGLHEEWGYVLYINGADAHFGVSTTQRVYKGGDTYEAWAGIDMWRGDIELAESTINCKVFSTEDQEKTWTTVEDFSLGQYSGIQILSSESSPGYVIPDPLGEEIQEDAYGEVITESLLKSDSGAILDGDHLRIGITPYGTIKAYDAENGIIIPIEYKSDPGDYWRIVAGNYGHSPFDPLTDGYAVEYDTFGEHIRGWGYDPDHDIGYMSFRSAQTREDDHAIQVHSTVECRSLGLTHIFTLEKDKKYLKLDIILENLSLDPLNDIIYARRTNWNIDWKGYDNDAWDYLMDTDGVPIVMAHSTYSAINANPPIYPIYCGLAASRFTPNNTFACGYASGFDLDDASKLYNVDYNGRTTDGKAGLGWHIKELAPFANCRLTLYYIVADSEEELLDIYNEVDTRSWISLVHDAGKEVEWNDIVWSSDQPLGTIIGFQTRTASTQEELALAPWSCVYDDSKYVIGLPRAVITSPPGRLIEVKALFETSDPTKNPPVLHDITVQGLYKDYISETNHQVTLPPAGTIIGIQEYTIPLETIEGTGKFLLEGILYSPISQIMDTDSYVFYIEDVDVYLTYDPDKKIYKPNQTVQISGEVIHRGETAEPGLTLSFTAEDSTLYTETFDLDIGQTHPFTFTFPAFNQTFVMNGIVGDSDVSLEVRVDDPLLEVAIDCPEVILDDPFDVSVTLHNPGEVEVEITLDIAGESQEIVVPGSESMVVTRPFSTSIDLTIPITISGDISGDYTREVLYGEQAEIIFDPEDVYPQGKVNIPYYIVNRGFTDTCVNLEVTVGADTSPIPSVLILRDEWTEYDVAPILTSAGLEVTLSSVFEYEWDGTNPAPDGFDVVIYLDRLIAGSWYPAMPDSGQGALVDYVNNGGGLILTEWITQESSIQATMTDLILFDPENYDYYYDTKTITVVQEHPVTKGLPLSFAIPYHGGCISAVKEGVETLMTIYPDVPLIAVKELGQGRIVHYGIAGCDWGRPFLDENMEQLLVNSVHWACGQSGSGELEGAITDTQTIYLPQKQIISDALDYDLSPGRYRLDYSSQFGSGSFDFRVGRENDLVMSLEVVDFTASSSPPRVLILGDNIGEGHFQGYLEEAGIEEAIIATNEKSWTIYENQWDGTNPNPSVFDVVIVLNGAQNWQWPMPETGQTALVDFVKNGGGLILTEWITWEHAEHTSMADLILLDPTGCSEVYCNWYVNDLTVVRKHPVTKGLPNEFQILDHYGTRTQVKEGGEVVIAGDAIPNMVVVKEYGLGRIVHFAIADRYKTTAPFENMYLQQLLINAVNWASGKLILDEHEAGATVTIENIGCHEFAGDLHFDSEFLVEDTCISIPSGGAREMHYVLDLPQIEPGLYPLSASALSSGTVIQEATGTLNIGGPSLEIIDRPENPVYTPEEHASMNFTVSNSGYCEGRAELRLVVLDIVDDSQVEWIEPGEESEFSFTFVIPDDLPENNYKAVLEFNGETQDIPFRVEGINISVSASLDKALYDSGDTAVLTMEINNEGTINPNLVARASLGDYEDIQQFTLTDHEQIVLNLPVNEDSGNRISYSVYLDSGRALYINTMYIRMREGELTLYTDKGVYDQGETVTVFVETDLSGSLAVTALGYEGEVAINGQTQFSFSLPEGTNAGTYKIIYELSGPVELSGEYLFDIQGYLVQITECNLNKAIYNPVDELSVSIRCTSSHAFPSAYIQGWIYDPGNSFTEFIAVSQPLNEGENLIQVSGPFTNSYAGFHQLVYGIYKAEDDVLLTAWSEGFEVRGVALIALTADKETYEYTDTLSLTLEGVACENVIGELHILIEGVTLYTEPLYWYGSQQRSYEFDVEEITPGLGIYVLEAQVVSDGDLLCQKDTQITVVDTISPAVPTGLTYTPAGGMIALSWNVNPEEDLAGYNLFRDGEKLNIRPLGSPHYQDKEIMANKSHVYRVTAVDFYDNESEASQPITAILDNTPPVIIFTPATSLVSDSPVTVSYEVSDNYDSSPMVTTNYPSPTTFNQNGVYTINLSAEDDAGNTSERSLSVTIEGYEGLTVEMNLPQYWSLISLPVEVEDARISTLFPEATAVFQFTTQYELLTMDDSLEGGVGYWIYMPQAHTYSLTGLPIESYTKPNAPSGWMMIGGCSYPSQVSVSNGTKGAVFGFSTKYDLIGLGNYIGPIEPGKAYWINLSERSDLMVSQ